MKRNSLCKKAFMAAAVLSAAMLLSVPAEHVSAKEQANHVVSGVEQTIEVENDLKAANSFSNKQCGEDVYATLTNGTLTISGTGSMWGADGYTNISGTKKSVFFDDKDSIREVIIEDGVTYVGANVFWDFSQLEKVTLADSVETIGYGAFYNTGIRRLVCPKNLKSIMGMASTGTGAFENCSSLQSVILNDGLEEIGDYAFKNTNIHEVVIPEGCVYGKTYTFFGSNVTIHKKTTVTLNANGGTVDGSSFITLVQYEGEAYGKPSQLPTPVRAGYEFLGWYDWTDGIEGNNVAESTEKVKYHAELRAKWCNHSETIVKNAVDASYTSEGYTGDTCCKNPSCGKVLSYGQTIPCKTLSAPKMSSVENVKNGLKIKWTASQDAKGYYVYCKKNGVYQKIATVENGTSYVDESVKNATGKRYTYKVCAYYDSATSQFTGAKSLIRVASTSIKSLKSTSKKTMLVQWKKVSGCTGYQIQYSKDKNFKKGVTTKTISNSSDTYKKLTKLARGKKQYVRVRSYKKVNGKKYYSAWSGVKNAKVK